MSAPTRFNLSAWALRNRGLVLYAMIVLSLVGAWSYTQLGQSEDPPFTFRAMVVRTAWPGASAEQVSRQVTEPVEELLPCRAVQSQLGADGVRGGGGHLVIAVAARGDAELRLDEVGTERRDLLTPDDA